MTWEPEVDEIKRRREMALHMGGPERVQEQHDRGKLTVRERIDLLIDPGSFRERGILGGSAVYEGSELKEFLPKRTVFGLAELDGRTVAITGEDFTARPRTGSSGVGGGPEASVSRKVLTPMRGRVPSCLRVS